MCKSSNGFTLLETIMSLSLLLFTTAFLLPVLTHVMVERGNLELKSRAQQILNEELNSGEMAAEKTVTAAGVAYDIFWQKENGMWQVCVHWRDGLERTAERCAYVKK